MVTKLGRGFRAVETTAINQQWPGPCVPLGQGSPWTVFQMGGQTPGAGTVTFDGSGYNIAEGNSFDVSPFPKCLPL